jgi:hypothetical protein
MARLTASARTVRIAPRNNGAATISRATDPWHDPAMGVMTEYFSANSDDVAAAVIDGGPSATPASGFEPVDLGGIDPVVQMGTLEELLTGVDYDTVTDNPRQGHIVANRDGGECLVVALTDELQVALGQAPESQLREIAVEWAQTEEFWGQADPAALAEILIELGSLAREATARNERLYCWVCV